MNEIKDKVIVGLDISKEKIDVYYLPSKRHEVIANSPRAIGSWIKAAKLVKSKSQVILEPTGGYETNVVKALVEKDIAVGRVHPNQAYYFGIAMGYMAKTDKISAKVLAHFMLSNDSDITIYNVDYKEKKKMLELDSRLNQLKDIRHAESCRIGCELLSSEVKKSIKKSLKHLAKQIIDLEKIIDNEIEGNEDYSKKAKLLQTYKGVGKVVANALVMGMPELGTIKKGQACALIGVAPMNNDSGKKNGYRSIKGGRFYIRKKLYMAALVAARFNPQMREFYQRLLARGKLKKVALVAVMRRMICQLNAMVRDNTPWQIDNELTAQNA